MIETLIPDAVELCKMLSDAHGLEGLEEKDSVQQTVLSLLQMTEFLELGADVSGSQELTKVGVWVYVLALCCHSYTKYITNTLATHTYTCRCVSPCSST